MSVSKSIPKILFIFVALAAIVMASGCGPNAEKEKMTAFMQEYKKTIEAYADVIGKADSTEKAEIKAKLVAFKDQWTHLKDEIGTEVTPQTMEKFDAEFKNLSAQYAKLSG